MFITIIQTGTVQFVQGADLDPTNDIHDIGDEDFYLSIPIQVTAHTHTGTDHFCGRFYSSQHPGFTGLLVNGKREGWDDQVAKIIHITRSALEKLDQAKSIQGMVATFITGVYTDVNHIIAGRDNTARRQKYTKGYPDLHFGNL